eukprot:TRINITY_DN2102_c0_g1_i1.p1 TRINITY_DN2102_c0_g1~~TRINITY_DN2102_c0_g1_i1.p1  ORF type:complete len:186 (+),score=30.08 TRINITY_DN2102_c0_g1_i1:388-945(+)
MQTLSYNQIKEKEGYPPPGGSYPPPAYPPNPGYPSYGQPFPGQAPPTFGAPPAVDYSIGAVELGRVWIQNSTGPYLCAEPDSRLTLRPHHREWETWVALKLTNGKYAFRSHHRTYLRANPDGKVDLSPHLREWESWSIVPGNPDQNLRSLQSYHNTFLRVDKNTNVINLAPHSREWESYIIHAVL